MTGATGQTGRTVCAALVAAGNSVIAVGSNADRLASVDATARYAADLTNPLEVGTLAQRAREEFGAIDGLVHLVGGWRAGHDADDWDWLEPRLLTTLRLATLEFAADLAAAQHGRLVVIGSASAAKPTWSGANYSTLKTAADAWVAGVASGWRKAGTAAAVTLVVQSIGDDATPVETIAAAITPLWATPAAEINGARIDLVP